MAVFFSVVIPSIPPLKKTKSFSETRSELWGPTFSREQDGPNYTYGEAHLLCTTLQCLPPQSLSRQHHTCAVVSSFARTSRSAISAFRWSVVRFSSILSSSMPTVSSLHMSPSCNVTGGGWKGREPGGRKIDQRSPNACNTENVQRRRNPYLT